MKSTKKITPIKKGDNKIDLAKLIPRLGIMPEAQRKVVMKAFQKAQAEHDKKDSGKLFNPTSMDEKTFLNFMDYLRLNTIDRQTGNFRDFVPTQDYEQEVAREFRDR